MKFNLFQPAQHFYGKREGSGTEVGSGFASGSVIVTNGCADPGGPKTYRSYGSESGTLPPTQWNLRGAR
jgi:hypothetical protein